MDSAIGTIGLPIALAIIMFGMGLSLTVDDFRRIAREPKAVAVALGAQLLILPALCFGLVVLFDPVPAIAVGMMLLAASPGGTSANLFSHLFRGDVALNVSLTAVNSVIAVFTLPVVVNFAVAYFDYTSSDGEVGLQFGKTLEVFAIVLVPVIVGMLVRFKFTDFAVRSDKTFRIMSAVILALVIVGALVAERANLADYLAAVGSLAAVFCVVSLTVGYAIPRLLQIDRKRALATAFEVGVHNGTLAITVAISVLGDKQLAVPAAIYSVLMGPIATIAGFLLTAGDRKASASAPAERSESLT